jgi:hypothetical protein
MSTSPATRREGARIMPILTGSDYSREIRFTSGEAPLDLTGFALELVIKARRGIAPALVTLTIGDGLSIADPADGRVVMSLTAAQTTAIGAGERLWAIYRCDGGRRLCLASGRVRVRRGL